MDRRTMMQCGAAAMGLAMMPRVSMAGYAPSPDGWRSYELVTEVTLPPSAQGAQAWVPVPAMSQAQWQKPGLVTWQAEGAQAQMQSTEKGASFLHAVWGASDTPRKLTLTARAEAQDRDVDLTQPGQVAPLSAEEHARFTAATRLLPTDGIVRQTADTITHGKRGDLEKARAIYDWIVVNTMRDPKTRGCGLGDISFMLTSGDLQGKCADLNALFVGLARAAGVPARDAYGIRVAPSRFGYHSLGANSSDVTKAQHCRAEVWLQRFGWVPVDPADVRKVMLQEPPGNLGLDDPKVTPVRKALFGAWEGNWIGYSFAHDVVLPGADDSSPLPFLMYPQAEVDGVRRDSLDAKAFEYTISAREVKA